VYGQGVIELTPKSVINLGVRLDDNEKFGTHFTVRAGGAYRLSPTLRARGSVGTSFKEPSLRENYAQGFFERGNPDLDPEQARSWEVGLEQSFLAGDGSIAANYFDQKFRDLIQYDGAAAADQPTYQNIAKATARGVEIITHIRPMPQFTFGASYTYLFTRVDDAGFATSADDIFVEGKPLVRRPKHSARFDVRGAVDRVSVGAGLNYVGKRDDVDFRPFPQIRTSLGSYVTVDADAAVDIIRRAPGRPGLAATFRAENLFDKSYDTVVGFAARGRLLLVGARFGW
jgi:vitamin B12 transporter